MGIKQIIDTIRRRVGNKKNEETSDSSQNLPPPGTIAYVEGCSATSASDIAAYYDRVSYPTLDGERQDQWIVRDWWHQVLRDNGRYQCYAFFLCLPADVEAVQYLEDFGKELDVLSGQNCLVIALTNTNFKCSGLSKDVLWNMAANEQVSEGYSVGIARRFDISFMDFPCLVLFEDIRSPEHITYTFKGQSSQQIATQVRQIFALVDEATKHHVKPLTRLHQHQRREGYQKVGQSMLGKVSSLTDKTFETAMEAWIKTII